MDVDRPRRLTALRFVVSGRFGFFLRAEAARAGLSYPVPPRTALLGMCAAVVGLEKDALATEFGAARVAIAGALPPTHWHCGNHRKVPPSAVPGRVRLRGSDDYGESRSTDEKNTQLRQEWLVGPRYEVVVALPPPHHAALARRLAEGTCHFTPCLGLSEMLATIERLGVEELVRLDEGVHAVTTVVAAAAATIDANAVARDRTLQVLSLRMPREVTADRRFLHASYFVERSGRPLPCRTAEAWRGARGVLCFL